MNREQAVIDAELDVTLSILKAAVDIHQIAIASQNLILPSDGVVRGTINEILKDLDTIKASCRDNKR